MKQTIALKDKQLREQLNGKFNNIGSAVESKQKITAAISSSVRS
jgi:hypothetical protein